MIKLTKYHVKLTFLTEMLGTAPSDPQIYSDYIATKKHSDAKKKLNKVLAEGDAEAKTTATEVLKGINDEEVKLTAEEIKMLPELTEANKGITVFRRHPENKNLILTDFMIRGFLKESATAVSGIWGINSKIDKWCFVEPRIIPITRNGEVVMIPDGTLERTLRAKTMQGDRTALAASEYLNPGVSIEFDISVFPLGADPKKGNITEVTIREWLWYGNFCGLGQWRSGSYGRFTYEGEQPEIEVAVKQL